VPTLPTVCILNSRLTVSVPFSGSASERFRRLYFHSYASVRESSVPVSVLKNRKMLQDSIVQKTFFVESRGKRAGQSTVEVMTNDGILLYPLISTNEIACWNSGVPFVSATQHVLKNVSTYRHSCSNQIHEKCHEPMIFLVFRMTKTFNSLAV
jgi:hypothetical protein